MSVDINTIPTAEQFMDVFETWDKYSNQIGYVEDKYTINIPDQEIKETLREEYEFDGGIYMPRTKGSKNKPKVINDFASQIAEKRSSIESLNTEIASITANIDSLKVDLKAKRAALKSAEKEVGKLEAKKSKEDQKVAEEAKKAEAETMLKKLLADGMSAEEILAKLK